MQYRDFEGSAEIDTDAMVCRGKILFIDDLVTYKASSPADLVQEFRAAVDDYLETCAQVGKSPQKPCKGQFNVRVTPELHRKAQRRATEENSSLNAVVAIALDRYLNDSMQGDVDLEKISPSHEISTLGGGKFIFVMPNLLRVDETKRTSRLRETESGSFSQTTTVNLKMERANVH
jgi:predicted HicB family RNase H-like nuclease